MLSVLTILFSFYHSDEISKHHWKLWRNRVLNMILQGVLSIKIAQKSLKMVKSPKFFGACGGQKGARYARQPKMATPPCTITPVTPLVVVIVPGVPWNTVRPSRVAAAPLTGHLLGSGCGSRPDGVSLSSCHANQTATAHRAHTRATRKSVSVACSNFLKRQPQPEELRS